MASAGRDDPTVAHLHGFEESSVGVIISPGDGEKVKGVQTVTLKLFDENGFTDHVEIKIGDRPPQTLNNPKKISSISWDTQEGPNGPIKIQATAYDQTGATIGDGWSTPRVVNPAGVVQFASSNWNPAEHNYSTIEKEVKSVSNYISKFDVHLITDSSCSELILQLCIMF